MKLTICGNFINILHVYLMVIAKQANAFWKHCMDGTAYFTRIMIYASKMFVKLSTGGDLIKLFFLVTHGETKAYT